MTWDRNSDRARTIGAGLVIASPPVGMLAAVALHSPAPMPAAFCSALVLMLAVSRPNPNQETNQ